MNQVHDAVPARTQGMKIDRIFSREGVSPYDEVKWVKRTAEIKDADGSVVFRQEDVEVPAAWSQMATNVVASKYYYGDISKGDKPPEGGRESSVKQLVGRVASTIARWGLEDGHLASEEDAARFDDELAALCLNQCGSFNSPVWFNVGLHDYYGIKGAANNWRWDSAKGEAVPCEDAYRWPQGSACFIQSISDDMGSIMDLAKAEAMLFKFGSGTGTDLSTLRSSKEKLSGGGKPSGPVSFMRVYDAIASVVKSGGKTRRAAKMQTLKVRHPDILDFIRCKSQEEKKAHALIAQGYDANFNGEAYSSIQFQNSNLSVRATDDFLKAAEEGGDWTTLAVSTGKPVDTYKAAEILDEIAEGAWFCGDPGLHFEDTISRWHTCPNTAPINSSNPCSEFVFLDDSACNLASINLMKFRKPDGTFDAGRFRAACRIFLTAQEILVGRASYPTKAICENSHKFRPLGLGYCNLGALIMASGYAYDSREGRAMAACITAIMHGEAALTSALLAAELGPFEGFEANREPMLAVMARHRDAACDIDDTGSPQIRKLKREAQSAMGSAIDAGGKHGYRNAQFTLLAPTGTIAFMMDADTTGIEPAIALVAYKALAGGGSLKIVNQTVPLALEKLGYFGNEIDDAIAYIDKSDTIEGFPLKPEHLPVFDCAFPPANGNRSISWEGHLRMMSAVQPFLSGAISKTVNMPKDSTVADIRDAYLLGWRLGLKCVAVYRDGCKQSQPLNTSAEDSSHKAEDSGRSGANSGHKPARERLPDTRRSLTHKFSISGHEGYLTVGLYEDGRPGELFITMSKEGSTIGGLMDAFATSISMGLQHGVPLAGLVSKFEHQRFEPSGFTRNADIPIAKSLVDYIFRWLGIEFLPGYREANSPHREDDQPYAAGEPISVETYAIKGSLQADGPPCGTCHTLTVRCGACYRCPNCGSTTGCG